MAHWVMYLLQMLIHISLYNNKKIIFVNITINLIRKVQEAFKAMMVADTYFPKFWFSIDPWILSFATKTYSWRTLLFSKKKKNLASYPSLNNNILSVLTSDKYFMKKMLVSLTIQTVAKMLSQNNPHTSLYAPEFFYVFPKSAHRIF